MTDKYAESMRLWNQAGRRPSLKPRADFQHGSHINTLPVENNQRGTSGVLIPTNYIWHGQTVFVPEDFEGEV